MKQGLAIGSVRALLREYCFIRLPRTYEMVRSQVEAPPGKDGEKGGKVMTK